MKRGENGGLRLVGPGDEPVASDEGVSAARGSVDHHVEESDPHDAGAGLPAREPATTSDLPEDDDEATCYPDSGELNIRIIHPLVEFVRDNFGSGTLDSIARSASLDPLLLEDKNYWISSARVAEFMAGVRELVTNDSEFKAANVYRLRESYGPLRFLLRAISPTLVYELGQKHFPVMSRISSGDMVRLSKTRILLRYWSKRPESRLMCLSRQAQSSALPTLWGLPRAHLTEKKCICWGHDQCEYELRLHQPRSWIPVLLGALVGLTVALALYFAGLLEVPEASLWFAMPSVGALIGYLFEARRTNRENFTVSEEINEELRTLVRQNARDRLEIIELHKREREWAQRMEETVAERTAVLEDVLDQVKRMHEEKRSVLRGFSHDLTNPFQVVYSQADMLRRISGRLDPELRVLVDDQVDAVKRMDRMLRELVETASTDAGLIRVKPERMDVGPLVDVLRRRARAFAHDRDIRVSVLSTREAPASIVTDRLVFDRVTDNLLTNASKYTERGSIVVELDGKPGFLTIKVSDTGRGIDDCDIDRIFRPKGSDKKRRKKGSHGVGLSVVVQLLGQIGGKLEVKSMPGKGTTFWAHFPEVLVEPEKTEGRVTSGPRLSEDELIGQVVNVRKSQPP